MAEEKESPYYAIGQWSRLLPADTINVGDIVIQRSINQFFENEKVKSNSKELLETTTQIPKSKKLDELMLRLDKLESKYSNENDRLNNDRIGVQKILKKIGLSPKTIQTGYGVKGLYEGGCEKNINLLCHILSFVDMKSRSSILIADKNIKQLFSGTQLVVSSAYRSNAPPLELLSQNLYKTNNDNKNKKLTEITFYAKKENVKVISLKKNDEVFFRPNMLTLKYDSDQDWPRGRIESIREKDGIIVIKTWSWKLAGNSGGATIYAQWTDVRRAPNRTKYQMLPEQRVWKSQELKEEATKLFTLALKEEKMSTDWVNYKKSITTDTPSSSPKKAVTPVKKATTPPVKTTPVSKKETAPLLNSMFVLLSPKISQNLKAIEFVESKLTNSEKDSKIVEKGEISSDLIKKHNVIDIHYSTLSEHALNIIPSQLDVLKQQRDMFEKTFNLKWVDCIKNNSIMNVKQFENEIMKLNRKKNRQKSNNNNDQEGESVTLQSLLDKSKQLQLPSLWLGKGLHIMKIDLGNEVYKYVINAFYPKMKDNYLSKPVYYFIVEWNSDEKSWLSFENEIIGITSSSSSKESTSTIRSEFIRENTLDLYGFEPLLNESDNGIYTSSSPLVSLIDKANWLSAYKDLKTPYIYSNDSFGYSILGNSLNESLLLKWHKNPLIAFEGSSHMPLFDHVKNMNAPECALKVKAIASDAYGKLEAAKQRYMEAVNFIDGDDMYDPGLDRREKVPPSSITLALASELKVSIFNNIALCCKKLITACDRMTSSDGNQFKEIRSMQCRQLVEYSNRTIKIIDMLALRGTHAKPIVNLILKKHEEAKFFGQMRCKALFYAAGVYADAESPYNDIDLALDVLKRAKTEIMVYTIAPASSTDKTKKKTSNNKKAEEVSASLKKLLDAQRKEIDVLTRKCIERRKKQQAAGKKRWSAAFEKNAKDPQAGLPPPSSSGSPSPVDVMEQARLEQAFMNEGIQMPDGSRLGGADLMGGAGGKGKSPSLISEIKQPPPPPAAASSSKSYHSKEVEEEEVEHEDDSLAEHLLGAAAIAGVAAAVGFGLMWLKKRN